MNTKSKPKPQTQKKAVRCPSCGHGNPPNTYSCLYCGGYLYTNPTAAERLDASK